MNTLVQADKDVKHLDLDLYVINVHDLLQLNILFQEPELQLVSITVREERHKWGICHNGRKHGTIIYYQKEKTECKGNMC